MLPTDLKTLAERLTDLAEVFERKPPSERALAVWFDTLKDFQIERVAGLLISWPKTHTKFPAPAEMWKACNDFSIGQREAKAVAERSLAFQPGVSGEQAGKFIAEIRAKLKQPRWTPAEHWRRNLKRFPAEHIGNRYAMEALGMKSVEEQPLIERVPGEDDEERRAA